MIASIVGAETESSPEPSQRGMKMEPVGAGDTPGEITGITCPDCHGSIWLQGGNGDAAAFTCRVGHSYSPEVFFEIQAANVENALWAGVRSLEEKASLAAVMASRAARFDDREAAERYEMRRQAAGENAETLRKLLLERAES
jgi:two-component system chemotaxis response regulator CheB